MRDIIDQQTRPQDDLMDCLDDPERYASVLARHMAHIPVFDDIEMSLVGRGDRVILDERRFQDALSWAMLDLAGAEARSIRIHLNGNALELEADIASDSTMGRQKIQSLSRRFELAGAPLTVRQGAPW
ncbi:MAG TPA: hypothetical protein VLH13_00240, partial [Methanomassiliicoccales archaeon]|nr:hypothetical protein [Methanomassiliicoccales archaeon]